MTPGTPEPTVAKSKRTIIDSSSEVRIGWVKVIGLLAAIVVAWNVGNHVWYRQTGDPWFGIEVAEAQAAEPTLSPTVEVVATEPSTPQAVVTTVFRETIVEVVVTATPTPVPPTPQIEYVYVQIESTVVVEVTPATLPTLTPVPLAPGTISICASVEGASELYIGGVGVVSGECKRFSFGVGQTSIQVQVNK